MKFKLDENVPQILKKIIEKNSNHKVDSVFLENLTGIDDKSLNLKCFREQRVLITLDTDFINVTEPYYGIIILRSKVQGKNAVKTLFKTFLANFELENSIGKIIIVESNQIRIRSEG